MLCGEMDAFQKTGVRGVEIDGGTRFITKLRVIVTRYNVAVTD